VVAVSLQFFFPERDCHDGFLIHQWTYSKSSVKKDTAAYLVRGVLIFIAFGVVTKTFLLFSSAHAAPVLDWSALKLDAASFGFSPSAWAWSAVRENAAVRRILAIAYEALRSRWRPFSGSNRAIPRECLSGF